MVVTRYTSSFFTGRKLLQVWLLLYLVTSTIPAFGEQDVYAEISKFQERFQKLSEEFLASQSRILSSTQTFAAQESAYAQLEQVAGLLSSNGREFDVLYQVLNLAMLVTDKRALPLARKSVEVQRDYMVKQMIRAAGYIDKTIHRAGDQETSRLLLQGRDLLRAGSDFASGITLALPKAEPR